MPISSAPLAKKLMLKPGMKGLVLQAPKGFALEAPEGATLATRAGAKEYDFGLLFAKESKALAKGAPALVARMREDSIAWVAWPKKTGSIETDLTRDGGWEALWETGWEGVALVSIDDDWSAWRIRPSGKVTRSPEALERIAARERAVRRNRSASPSSPGRS